MENSERSRIAESLEMKTDADADDDANAADRDEKRSFSSRVRTK
jgi:hypothetical protein